ncbi:AbrB/MazE/SpoVT family DNA-binding domain-containing protein [Halosimplex marinum]|uniref:AbrB/MazE/SpoVT family DNA-binding domain-containing protein n=1 Tax=Halosimplex marinum TaxID=3396620 RepID=UPI003F57A7A7
MSRPVEDETTVGEGYSTTVPASVRERAEIEAGDRLRWTVDEDGAISVRVVERGEETFGSLDPVELDEETDAAEDHDAVAGDH